MKALQFLLEYCTLAVIICVGIIFCVTVIVSLEYIIPMAAGMATIGDLGFKIWHWWPKKGNLLKTL